MNDLIKFKKNRIEYIHIFIIIFGAIFSAISVFHPFLWFDESYSVGIANHTFSEIWSIGGHDVHPVFYYYCLHILNIFFGNNIIIYRLFSLFCTIAIGIIGYTHIRKDFGEKIGLLFSFFSFFFPTVLVYTGEIRMYTLAMLLVTLTSIYAYRIYKYNLTSFSIKNWIIFAICSILSAYTHYYALMASGLINLILMIYFIVEFIKTKKITKNIIAFIISGVIQILLYIPWIISLLLQMSQVSNGFWINIHFPDTIIELFTFQFTGNLTTSTYIPVPLAILWGLFITIYLILIYIKSYIMNDKKNIKKEMKPAIISLKIFLGIALAACIVSLILWRPIIYARYMLCILGLFIFFIAYSIVKIGYRKINIIICLISIVLSSYINISFIQKNYSKNNILPINYLQEDIQENDIILIGNDLTGIVISVNFPQNISYFYDKEVWNVDEAYKAFSNDFRTIYSLDYFDNYSGRIWIINSNYSLYEEFKDKYNIELLKQDTFETDYKNDTYAISLVLK
jgi:uncharacterized membrane protein